MRDYREYRLNRNEKSKYFIASGALFFIAGLIFYHNFIIAFALVFLAIPLKKQWESHLASKIRMELTVQFKDLLASLSSSFFTGRQLTEALVEGEQNLALIYSNDTPIMLELKQITNRLTVGLEKEREVLFDFADRSASEDIVNFIDVYFTCQTTGGDIVKAVRKASSQIIDKIELKKEMSTMIAQKKYETVILVLLPPIILTFLQLSSPEYVAPLYGNIIGIIIMTLALGLMAASFLWSVRITNIVF